MTIELTDEPGGGWLANAAFRNEGVHISLQGSRCRAPVDGGDERCPFQARYFMLTSNGYNTEKDVIGVCGHHVSDGWLQALDAGEAVGDGLWDAHEVTCDHDLATANSLHEPTVECPFRARTLIVQYGTGGEHAACAVHAMNSWLEFAEPSGADAEADGSTEATA